MLLPYILAGAAGKERVAHFFRVEPILKDKESAPLTGTKNCKKVEPIFEIGELAPPDDAEDGEIKQKSRADSWLFTFWHHYFSPQHCGIQKNVVPNHAF